jgi:pSer/pThr/pTyr-binding forkhead associated (FHA) protein/S1-C subfamily serine protease
MPYLKLLEKGSKKSHRVDGTEAVVGRDPAAAIFVEGDAAKTVSGRHARFFLGEDGKWYVEDTGSRNGTYIGSRKLESGSRHPLSVGDCVGLGLTGTQLVVEDAVGRAFAATMLEAQSAPVPFGTVPMRRSEAIRAGIHDQLGQPSNDEVRVVLRATHSGARVVGQSNRITLGRALECLIRVEGETATSVSRVHSEIISVNGKPSIRDAGSRHGTYVNGKKLQAPTALAHGDLIMLGPGGPTFTVDEAALVPPGAKPPQPPPPASQEQRSTDPVPSRKGSSEPPPVKKAAPQAKPPDEVFSESPTPPLARHAIKTSKGAPGPATRLARASLGVGRTALFRDVLEEVSQKGARRIRFVVWSVVGVFAVVTTVIVVYAKQHMDRTDAQLAEASVGFQQQAATLDSLRLAATTEALSARASLDSAMHAAAPKAVLDSLRGALADADRRSTGLEESLKRARVSLDAQLGGADSMRRAAEQELLRLKAQVASAQATGADSRAVLDSLQRSLRSADDRVKEMAGQVRALKGADFPQIAQVNQGAVGLVTVSIGKDFWDGSGFVISPSGLFLTNRHVVRPEGANLTDTSYAVFVTMSDHSASYRTEIVYVSPASGPDFALLRIRNYKGPVVAKVDWTGTHAVQGEGAALIGFPAGFDNAADEQKVVRSSMTAGNFATVTPELIQFAGLSVAGSSGSPLFNGAGEVVGLHRAGLREKPGFGYAVPLARVAPLLPADVRAELGLSAK